MQDGALSLLSAAAIALAGCDVTPSHDSDQISTRDMTIELKAASDEGGGVATIEIESPIGDARLAGGDALTLTAEGAYVPLREADSGDKILYKGDLGMASGDLAIDLVRPHDRSARDVSIRMPPPFTLTAQGLTTKLPLSLTWDAALGDYTVALSIDGDCITTLDRALSSDTGAYAVEAAELQHKTPTSAATCPLTVKVERSVMVQIELASPLRGGLFSAQARQSRTVEVDWQP